MKRRIFAVLAVGAIALASCNKVEEPVAPVAPGSATVKGTLWANTNQDNDTDQWGWPMYKPERAPAGILVTVVVNGYDLDRTPDGAYDYPDYKFTGTTDGNGEFTISGVSCLDHMTDAQIRFNDFSASVLSGGNNTVQTFDGDSWWISIYDGAVVIEDYNY